MIRQSADRTCTEWYNCRNHLLQNACGPNNISVVASIRRCGRRTPRRTWCLSPTSRGYICPLLMVSRTMQRTVRKIRISGTHVCRNTGKCTPDTNWIARWNCLLTDKTLNNEIAKTAVLLAAVNLGICKNKQILAGLFRAKQQKKSLCKSRNVPAMLFYCCISNL